MGRIIRRAAERAGTRSLFSREPHIMHTICLPTSWSNLPREAVFKSPGSHIRAESPVFGCCGSDPYRR